MNTICETEDDSQGHYCEGFLLEVTVVTVVINGFQSWWFLVKTPVFIRKSKGSLILQAAEKQNTDFILYILFSGSYAGSPLCYLFCQKIPAFI